MRSALSFALMALVASCGPSPNAKPPSNLLIGGNAAGESGGGAGGQEQGGQTAPGGAGGGGAAGASSSGGSSSTGGTGGAAGSPGGAGGSAGTVRGGASGQAGKGGGGGSVSSGGVTSRGGTTGSSTSPGGAGGGGVPGICTDGKLSGDETDVDCGGENCPARCGAGKRCLSEFDCDSSKGPMTCPNTLYRCVDSCTDGLKGGTEVAVDCGGLCPLKCVGDPCTTKADCQSQNCDTAAGKCIQPDHPLILINQPCWDKVPANAGDKTLAKQTIVPCMIKNLCCKTFVNNCTDPCFVGVDNVCGLNKFSGGAAPHDFILNYYKTCVQ